jgi:hypothetical protein
MAAVDFLASRGMGEAQGKKVEPAPLRLRRSRRSRPSARSSQGEARCSCALNSILRGDVADINRSTQVARLSRRRKRNVGVQKGSALTSPNRAGDDAADGPCRCRPDALDKPSTARTAAFLVNRTSNQRIDTNNRRGRAGSPLCSLSQQPRLTQTSRNPLTDTPRGK